MQWMSSIFISYVSKVNINLTSSMYFYIYSADNDQVIQFYWMDSLILLFIDFEKTLYEKKLFKLTFKWIINVVS